MTELNYFAVVGAAAANMALGALWYSPLMFGKRWLALMGWSEQEFRKRKAGAGRAYLWSAVAALVSAFVLAQVIILAAAVTATAGAMVGFWVWLGFAATAGIATVVFEGRKLDLYLIYGGYQLVAYLIMGAVLGRWV